MAAWMLPALKAILPHVGTIIEAAKPVFSRKGTGAGKQVSDEQIVEVQAAITQNADHIKALAEQLRQTVAVLGQQAEAMEARLKRAYRLCAASLVVSLVALGLAVAAWLGR
jgi:hypothetical protein